MMGFDPGFHFGLPASGSPEFLFPISGQLKTNN
jgi:hypothetical protein